MCLFINKCKDYILLLRWILAGKPASFPPSLKRQFLIENISAPCDWIETGTYKGLTTRYLAKVFPASRIVTIEPAEHLHEAAKKFLSNYKNITLLKGDSAVMLEQAIALVGENVAFFLDGHFSGYNTFKNDRACPINEELAHIKNKLARFTNVVIFIDDARLFHQAKETGYPSVEFLSAWATENGFSFEEKNDIFILRKAQ